MIGEYEAALPAGGWPNWVLGNHDRPRVASKRGAAQARVAAMLLLTLRGTPTLYYGDELGLADVAITPDQVKDPLELREPGLGRGRDPVRTPMAWDDGANGGFTGGAPWLPLHADWPTRNVAAQAGERGSMLSLYRDLLRLRRAHPALALGDFALLESDGDVLAYERRYGGTTDRGGTELGRAPAGGDVAYRSGAAVAFHASSRCSPGSISRRGAVGEVDPGLRRDDDRGRGVASTR